MNFETAFNCGDKAWVYSCGVEELTVGQVQITYTDSKGCPIYFGDNYSPQQGYEERYMCDESGIGAGTVYTLGESIFKTKEECEAANAKQINEAAAALQYARGYQQEQLLAREAYYREQIANIEALKKELA